MQAIALVWDAPDKTVVPVPWHGPLKMGTSDVVANQSQLHLVDLIESVLLF